jgi:hypothetical protein
MVFFQEAAVGGWYLLEFGIKLEHPDLRCLGIVGEAEADDLCSDRGEGDYVLVAMQRFALEDRLPDVPVPVLKVIGFHIVGGAYPHSREGLGFTEIDLKKPVGRVVSPVCTGISIEYALSRFLLGGGGHRFVE